MVETTFNDRVFRKFYHSVAAGCNLIDKYVVVAKMKVERTRKSFVVEETFATISEVIAKSAEWSIANSGRKVGDSFGCAVESTIATSAEGVFFCIGGSISNYHIGAFVEVASHK